MKSVKEALLARRSIRRYEREPIPTEQMNLIYEAIRNTPTSYNGQQFSVIDIADQDMKVKLYEIAGEKQIKTCNHFLVFLADLHKIDVLAKAKGVTMPDFAGTVDGVMVAMVDASLAMMSAVAMAEALGLGTCCVGQVRTCDPRAIAELLKLPPQTMVVCGLAIGVPRELPDMKPKQPLELVVHRDFYRQDDMLPELQTYDATITDYNQHRAGGTTTNDWCAHIVHYYDEAMDYEMLKAIRERGFDVKE